MSSPYEFEKNAREIKEDCNSAENCFDCPYLNRHVKVVETNGEVSRGRCMWACIGMDEPWRWNFDYDQEE